MLPEIVLISLCALLPRNFFDVIYRANIYLNEISTTLAVNLIFPSWNNCQLYIKDESIIKDDNFVVGQFVCVRDTV